MEITRERNKRIDQINVEKKKCKVMKNDFDFQKRRADVLEKEVDRKKNELFMQAKELEKVYIENERVKDDLQYIQLNYDLDTIEDKFKSAKKTEDWAEQFTAELTQLFNCVE